MPKLHILFATPAYPPFPGGGERYAASLATHLSARGHRVTVVTSAAEQESDFWQGCQPQGEIGRSKSNPRVIRCAIQPMPGGQRGLLAWRKAMILLSGFPGSQPELLLRMANRIPAITGMNEAFSTLDMPVDVVHGFNISWEHALIAAWRYARSRGLPFVATPFAHLGSSKKDKVALNSTMVHQRSIMSDANALVVLTSIEAQGLRQHGAAPAKVAVIGAGLDPLPTPNDGPKLGPLAMSKFDISRPFALFIGRATYDKGAVHAAQAILSLHRQGVELSLVLVGQLSERFTHFHENLTAAEKQIIKPVGILDETTKHALLDESALLVLPSRSDSFGIVLLEAWSHGKPVIGAASGGIPGVIDDGKNGILVRFGDVQELAGAVRRLLEDEPLRQQMGENGRQKVNSLYNWEHSTDQVLDVYRSLLHHN